MGPELLVPGEIHFPLSFNTPIFSLPSSILKQLLAKALSAFPKASFSSSHGVSQSFTAVREGCYEAVMTGRNMVALYAWSLGLGPGG